MDAFADGIPATTRNRPWRVIHANHKWFRNLAVSQIIAETMEDLKLAYPPPSMDLAEIRRKYHAAVEEQNSGKNKA